MTAITNFKLKLITPHSLVIVNKSGKTTTCVRTQLI